MKSVTYFLSGPGSHIAFAAGSDGLILSAWAANNICSFGVGVSVHNSPCPGWVVCTREDYESIRAQALRFFSLLDQDAVFLAQIADYESDQNAVFLS